MAGFLIVGLLAAASASQSARAQSAATPSPVNGTPATADAATARKTKTVAKAKPPAAGTPTPAATTDSKSGTTPRTKEQLAGQGPLQFRCDKMQILTKPNRTLCLGNVVFRRGTILGCCKAFEGLADEQWNLQKAICNDDVRARRADETMWADHADYVPASGDLVFTGRPVLHRGQSIIEGDRVIANVDAEQAKVEKPRGRLVTEEQRPALTPVNTDAPPTTPLPATCPLPQAPR